MRRALLTARTPSLPGSFVAATGVTVATLVASITTAVPAGAAVGDRLLLFLLRNNATATWSELVTTAFTSVGTPTSAMAAYTRVVDGTEATDYNFQSGVNSANIGVAVMMLFRNVGTIADLSLTNQGSSTTIACASVAGASAGLLAGCVSSPINAAATYTAPGTMTERIDQQYGASNCVVTIADEILAAGGATGTRTFTRSVSSNQKGLLVAFNPI